MKTSCTRRMIRPFYMLTIGLTLTVFSNQAVALAPGCDPLVWDAQKAMAEARINADVGVADRIINQPDSVLKLTCFDDAHQVSAKEGGEIFSEDFSSDTAPLIQDVLQDFWDNNNFIGTAYRSNFGSVSPDDNNTTSVYTYSGNSTYNCQNLNKAWTLSVGEGITDKAPFATIDNLIANSVGLANINNYQSTMATGNKGGALNTALTNLPTVTIPAFTGQQTVCQVLTAAGMSC